MLRIPGTVASPFGKRNLDFFAASGAAREIEDRADSWTVVEWSWTQGPPMRIVLRGGRGQRMDVVFDPEGVWRMEIEPVDPRIHPMADVAARTLPIAR